MELRGFFGSFFQIGVTTGYVLGAALSMGINWNYLALVGQIIATILGIGMIFMPETPRWLLAQGYRKSGVNSLQ